MIDIDKISPNSRQPRKKIDEQKLDDLVRSISANGVLQPIIVRKLDSGKYQIIAGERRWTAAKNAGLKQIPAIIQEASDNRALELALIENIQRENLNPIDEAIAFRALSEEYGLTHEEVAKRVGRSRAGITNSLRLLSLPPDVRQALEQGRVTVGQVRPLLGLPEDDIASLAEIVVKNGLSARQVERLVKKQQWRRNNRKSDEKSSDKDYDPMRRYNHVIEQLRRKYGRAVEIRGSRDKGFVLFEYYSNDDLVVLIDSLLE